MYMMLLIHVHTTNGQENTTIAIVPESIKIPSLKNLLNTYRCTYLSASGDKIPIRVVNESARPLARIVAFHIKNGPLPAF